LSSKKSTILLSLLIIPLAMVVIQKLNSSPQATPEKVENQATLTPVTQPSVANKTGNAEDIYQGQYVIFFSGNMAEATTQKLFFDEHQNVQYLGEGNFPGVSVVRIDNKVEETLTYLKGKDYIDLIIKNQDGLDCHTN